MQKTAYEVRISDWSSDVCSSDLPGEQFQMARRGGPVDRPPVHSGPIFGERFELAALAAQPLLPQAEPAIALEQALALLAHRAQAGDDADAAVDEIGRASWRERGWQYV